MNHLLRLHLLLLTVRNNQTIPLLQEPIHGDVPLARRALAHRRHKVRVEGTKRTPILVVPAARLKVRKQGIRLGRQDDLHLVRRELDHAQDALGQREAARKCPSDDAQLDEGGAVAAVGRVEGLEEGEHADAQPLDGGGGHAADAPFVAVEADEVGDAMGVLDADGAGAVDGFGIEVFVVGFEEAEDLHYRGVVEEAAARSASSLSARCRMAYWRLRA